MMLYCTACRDPFNWEFNQWQRLSSVKASHLDFSCCVCLSADMDVSKAGWVALTHSPSALSTTPYGGHLVGEWRENGRGGWTHLPSFTKSPDYHRSATCRRCSAALLLITLLNTTTGVWGSLLPPLYIFLHHCNAQWVIYSPQGPICPRSLPLLREMEQALWGQKGFPWGQVSEGDWTCFWNAAMVGEETSLPPSRCQVSEVRKSHKIDNRPLQTWFIIKTLKWQINSESCLTVFAGLRV